MCVMGAFEMRGGALRARLQGAFRETGSGPHIGGGSEDRKHDHPPPCIDVCAPCHPPPSSTSHPLPVLPVLPGMRPMCVSAPPPFATPSREGHCVRAAPRDVPDAHPLQRQRRRRPATTSSSRCGPADGECGCRCRPPCCCCCRCWSPQLEQAHDQLLEQPVPAHRHQALVLS